MAFGVYLHIPYCRQKCRYCDFYSLGQSHCVPDAYIQALLDQLSQFSNCDCSRLRPDTVYFGGGTPSLLTPSQTARLLDALCPVPGAEITLEANPDTVTVQQLSGYRAAGINRLSFGVQSASNPQLIQLGRIHTAQKAKQALQMAAQAGFQNISGDIMLALPGYSYREFDDTLQLLLEGNVTHISCYLLKIEPGTPFAKKPPPDLPDEDAAADFYLYAVQQLDRHGFHQYEISNFAVPGFESRHNLIYWEMGDYLGLGAAAYSCMGGQRFHVPADLSAFLAGRAAFVEDGPADAQEYIMLQLRLAHGLHLPTLKKRWGITWSSAQFNKLTLLEKAGLCRLSDDRLILTPKGFLVQNSILTELF
ncbi:MAG: radical SAM family heme chaperone HemW [Pygmaiobacter massiliensis]|nr:radical SAM family heme chaperone HemW [Pygmaiobacter massiliensis]